MDSWIYENIIVKKTSDRTQQQHPNKLHNLLTLLKLKERKKRKLQCEFVNRKLILWQCFCSRLSSISCYYIVNWKPIFFIFLLHFSLDRWKWSLNLIVFERWLKLLIYIKLPKRVNATEMFKFAWICNLVKSEKTY